MSRYVQVINGEVVNFWDVPHTLPSPIGTDGWMDAVEVTPEFIEGRQYLGKYIYDTTQNPVVITQEVVDLSVEHRKINMIDAVEREFRDFVDVLGKSPLLFTAADVTMNKSICVTNEELINNASTHDELDVVKGQLQKIKLY